MLYLHINIPNNPVLYQNPENGLSTINSIAKALTGKEALKQAALVE